MVQRYAQFFLEKGLGIVFPAHFVYDFSRKMLLIYILLTDQILLSDCLCFLRYWAICVLQLFVSHVPDFAAWPKSQDKDLKSWERKELLKWNKKHFHYFWTVFSCQKSSLTWDSTFNIVNLHLSAQSQKYCKKFCWHWATNCSLGRQRFRLNEIVRVPAI